MEEKVGVFVGRFCPLHNGHINTINLLLEDYPINHLLIIGSANSPISIRNLFTYGERRELIKLVYPKIRLVGMGDHYQFGNDDWYILFDDIINSIFGSNINPIFYGGSFEDVYDMYRHGYEVCIGNRFKDMISATLIRNHLLKKEYKEIEKYVPKICIPRLLELYKTKLEIIEDISDETTQ